jgi:hypothetical protein
MRYLSRRRKWLVGILLAAAVVASCTLFLPRERLLMREAKKITTVNMNSLAQNRMRFSPCIWRSDHSVIIMTYRSQANRYEYVEVNTDTGVQRLLTVVNDKCRADLHMAYMYPRSGQLQPPGIQLWPRTQADPPFYNLSPDGQRLIYARWNFPVPFTYTCIALDGTEVTRWRSSEHWVRSLWLPDGRRWLEPVYKGNDTKAVVIHDTVRPDKNMRIAVPGTHGVGFALGVTQEERLVGVVRNSGQPVASVQMIDCDFLSPVPTIHEYTVRFPRFCTLRGVQLSTKRDRLAWVLLYDSTPQLSLWLHQILPRIPLNPQPTVGLWVSRLDGTNMTEIGHVAAASDGEPKLGYSLQWVPGDKKLSFSHNNVLFTVPIL